MDVDVEDSSVGEVIQEVKSVLWGKEIKEDLFHRWSQGFIFSPEEPTALIQREGGPCAVLAPVQSFILRAILRDPNLPKDSEAWRKLSPELVDAYLCQALTEILHQVAISDLTPPESNSPTKLQLLQQNAAAVTEAGTSLPPQSPQPEPPPQGPSQPNPYCIVILNQPLSRRISCESPDTEICNGPQSPSPLPHQQGQDKRLQRTEDEIFHKNLRLLKLDNINQVESVIKERLETFKGYYGVLQFLYSVLLTKGVQKLCVEMSEPGELIDPVHGHGGQSMINLFLSGKGASYVFDNDKDLGGLQLKGIGKQCDVGFLTVLERLRLCEVGSFLKNPKYPIWLCGSETHLTVIFSWNMELVKPESPAETARRVFQTYDPEGNNFIQAILLEDVMRTLGLFADTEYVDIIRKKLDPETLGIILLNDFMNEFYANEKEGGPDTFQLFYYNGLCRTSSSQKVLYNEGNAIILETDLRCLADDNTVLTCLQTKWPNIDVQWLGGVVPSMN